MKLGLQTYYKLFMHYHKITWTCDNRQTFTEMLTFLLKISGALPSQLRLISPTMYDYSDTFWNSLQWTPESPDLTPCKSSLWSRVKAKRYMTKLYDINEV